MPLTEAQEKAISARGRTLLVSAAAGSGKTFTLTKRIIKTILEDESRTIGRMLIVTFTRSAAADLKKKIAEALSEAIAAHPENTHLQEEFLKLGSAHICTIDSFFTAPVRENFEKLKLPEGVKLPSALRLADEGELSALREGKLRETLELFFAEKSGVSSSALSEIGHFSVYTDLLSLMSGIRDSSALIPTLLSFYFKTLTVPGGVEILKKSAERMLEASRIDFFETDEGKIIREAIAAPIKEALEKLPQLSSEAIRIADEQIGLAGDTLAFAVALRDKVAPCFSCDSTVCASLLAKTDATYSECYLAAEALDFQSFPSLRGDKKSSFSDDLREQRTELLKPIKKLKTTLLRYSQEEISNQYIRNYELCLLLYEILADFDRRYSLEKLERGICEFSDMPRFVLDLLENEDGTPTELAKTMAEQYDEVYIDEYQDVNAIQDKIFRIIGGDHRFMVGDIKQSIYCFRDAEPSIFAHYRETFPEYDPDSTEKVPDGGGSSIFMSENFRCDEGIIDFVNAICDKIFSTFAESINYNSETDLLNFRKFAEHFDPPKKVVINIVEPAPEAIDSDEDEEDEEIPDLDEDENEDKLYDEAVICANEIARLIRDKNETNAKGEKLVEEDIAILVRGNKQIPPIIKALSAIGIRYVTNAGGEILTSNEMKLLFDLLTVIDNPREDIPLCRTLTATLPCYSPLLTLEDVLKIRHAAKEGASLYDALASYAEIGEDKELKECADGFIRELKALRALSSRVSADKLLRALSRKPLFALLCESDAFIYLYSTACRYVKGAWNGLYSFILYFKGIMEHGSGASDPIRAQRDEVTIITMHQSKGLQYNVCFLFGIGKQFNMRELSAPIIFNRELGASMKLPTRSGEGIAGSTQIKREGTLIHTAATLLSRSKLLEEEARVFYVALTRARERLYLSATVSKHFAEIYSATGGEGESYMKDIKKGKSYLLWLATALHYCPRELYTLNLYQRGSIPPIADKLSRAEVESNALGITREDRSLSDMLNNPLIGDKKAMTLSSIPAKVAASKASRTMLDEGFFSAIPTGDLFSESDEDQREISADTLERINKRIELLTHRRASFDSLLEVNKRPTAAERGSAAHLILQFCDYEKVESEGLDREIERLVAERFITQRVSDIVNRAQLEGFFKSQLFALARKAKKVRREFRFGMFRSAADFTSKEELKEQLKDKNIFVQGSIDLILETEDGIILCDYKTDKVSDEERADRDLLIQSMKEKHAGQLEEYRYAVKEIFGESPIKTCIFSIPLGEVIEIK